MIDAETGDPLTVHEEGTAGPYLMVPLDQLHDVEAVLRNGEFRFTVAKDAIELDGKAVIAIIDFGVQADARRIQDALDAA